MTALLIKSAEKTAQHVGLENAVRLAWSLEVMLMSSSLILLNIYTLKQWVRKS